MKICLLIPLYSIISFLSICFPSIYVYANVWFSYFEAIALATVFLLMCEFISETNSERELFFSALKIQDKKGHVTTGYGSVVWYRVIVLNFVFQGYLMVLTQLSFIAKMALGFPISRCSTWSGYCNCYNSGYGALLPGQHEYKTILVRAILGQSQLRTTYVSV
jgi:Organic solute transporter Ostalpha